MKVKHLLITSAMLGVILIGVNSAFAAPTILKGQCGVHTVSIEKTPGDAIIETPLLGKFGVWNAGSCQFSGTANLGDWRIRTGDKFGFPGEYFKYYTNGEGKCAAFVFSYEGKQYETTATQLIWDKDKKTYTASKPSTSAISIQ